MNRALFFDRDDAERVLRRLSVDGFATELDREPFAGEDDDEDHPWVVATDAPEVMLELLVEEYDGWLDVPSEQPPGGVPPLDLPDAPRRVKGHFRAP